MAEDYGKIDQTPEIKTPASGPRPDKGVMDDTELHTLVSGLISSARQYIEIELTPDRAKATRYYKGEPFGNEQKGRSAFVVTEVHDGVQAMLPPIVRVLFGPEIPVEFRARNANTVDQAQQATDYINYIFAEEGDGFLSTLAVLKDGLIRKHGIWKWGWDETTETTQDKFTGTLEDLTALVASAGDDINVTLVRDLKDGTVEAEYTRTISDGKPWFCEVPPEEFIAIRETRKTTDSIFVAHQTRKSTGDLIAMGIKEADIKEHGGDDPSLKDDELALERTPLSGSGMDAEAGEANNMHLYVEGYARIDYDGDGVAELRKVCTIGPDFYVVHNDPCDDIPFAVWCPDPEPHSLMGGRSWADRLMDMQRLKSQLMRSLLDSASASIHPRKVYKEGDANLQDLLNTQIGAPIRSRSGVGSVTEFAHTFMGKDLIPVLAMTDDIVERRTGINKGAAGLSADALQSSTKAAVAAAVTASQAQQELIVRIFAEGALKPLFRGLLKLFCKYKPKARVVKLRGKYVEVNPAFWDANMDVQVNVALGSGLTEEKLQTLFDIKTTQEQILMQYGPQNPLVNIKQYRDTLAEMLALRGKRDASKYFLEITDEQVQKMAQDAKNAPPKPDPEMMKAQAQMKLEEMKAQATIQVEQKKAEINAQTEHFKAQNEVSREMAEAELMGRIEEKKAAVEGQKAMLEHQREVARIEAEIQLKREELNLKREEMNMKMAIEQQKVQVQRDVAAAQIESGERTAKEKNESSERVARHKSTSKPKGKE